MLEERGEDWVVKGFDKIRQKWGMTSDAQLAEHLGTTTAMINQIRGGRTKPSAKVKFAVADKLGWLVGVESVAWVVSQIAGDEVGKKLAGAILQESSPKKKS